MKAAGLVAGLWCASAVAQPCGEGLAGTPRTVESSRYAVAYVTRPPRISVGEHFVVDFAVCPRSGAPAPQSVRVDANMPEHRHGMNYRAGVVALQPGVYRAEGMLFHMRGHWDLTFDVVDGSRTERLASRIDLE